MATFHKKKREPTMPRLSEGRRKNLLGRCNNSSPRYERENHYAIFALLKISYVFTYKIA